MDIFLKCRFCILKRRVKSLTREIRNEYHSLMARSNMYHGGRLDVDSMIKDYSDSRRIKIFGIKRNIVKVKLRIKNKGNGCTGR